MDRHHAMKVLVRIVDAGGFAPAARELNMSPPAVTRAVAALEDLIGARLLTRTTRQVKLTEAGQRYVEDCRHILAAIEEAEASASGSFAKPRGQLTVTAPIQFGQIYILPIMMAFLDTYPEVTGNLLLLDRVTNLVDEGIDVAIRIGPLPDSSYSASKVGSVRRVICGAPTYFQRHGVPQLPSELNNHRIIAATGAGSSLEWRFGAQGAMAATVKPTLFSNSIAAATQAARAGWGITRLISYQVAADLRDGTLQTVLDAFEEAPLPIHVVHAEGRKAAAKVRAFVDFASAELRSNRLIN